MLTFELMWLTLFVSVDCSVIDLRVLSHFLFHSAVYKKKGNRGKSSQDKKRFIKATAVPYVNSD